MPHPLSTTLENERYDRHFRTDHLMKDLKGRSVRGGATVIAAQGVKFVLQTASTMILARKLAPADFGLVSMVTVVTGFVAMFKDAGLSMATVQKAEISHEQVSNLFWINVSISIALSILIAALAPAIAWFYGEPRLVWITIVLAGTFIFGGLTVQHQALLRRQMRFKHLAIIDIISMTVGIGASIIMVFMNFGYWSLIGLTTCTAFTTCGMTWIYSGWRPGVPTRGTGVGSMLRFGGGLTGFSLLNYFTRNADNVIVGFELGSGPLGIYSKAYNLLMMPIRQLNGPVGSVMVPTLSRLQSQPDRYCSAYLRATGILALVGMPIVAFLFVVSNAAVLLILGPSWTEAATVFRLLSPAALFGTVNVAPGWLCTSLGRAKTQVIWAAISAPITIVGFVIGIRWGINGVATSFSITWCGLFVVFMYMACRHSPVRFEEFIKTILLPLCACILAAIICLIFVPQNLVPLWSIPVNGGIFGMTYILFLGSVPSGRQHLHLIWSEILKFFRRFEKFIL